MVANNQAPISYIQKVLTEEMKMVQQKQMRYHPFGSDDVSKLKGRPFLFINPEHQSYNNKEKSRFDVDDSPPF